MQKVIAATTEGGMGESDGVREDARLREVRMQVLATGDWKSPEPLECPRSSKEPPFKFLTVSSITSGYIQRYYDKIIVGNRKP